MALIERLMGLEDPRIPVHQFQAIAAERARGNISPAQAQAAIEASSGAPLDSGEVAEALALIATVPTGSTADEKASRALRLFEIDQVLLMASQQLAPYNDPAVVRTRLGL